MAEMLLETAGLCAFYGATQVAGSAGVSPASSAKKGGRDARGPKFLGTTK
jgi:hypothetical protein